MHPSHLLHRPYALQLRRSTALSSGGAFLRTIGRTRFLHPHRRSTSHIGLHLMPSALAHSLSASTSRIINDISPARIFTSVTLFRSSLLRRRVEQNGSTG